MVITLIDTCVMTNSFHKQFYHNVNKGMLTKYNGLAQLLYDICLGKMAKCFYINTVPLGEKKKEKNYHSFKEWRKQNITTNNTRTSWNILRIRLQFP